MKRMSACGLASLLVFAAGSADAQTYRRLQLTDKFWSEGAAWGDFNQDGALDLCAGPFWYAGPDFTNRHTYRPATASFKCKAADGTEQTIEGFAGALSDQNAYADDFLNFVHDFNADGWPDIMALAIPGSHATWFENPRGQQEQWTGHRIADVVDNESPLLADLTGDGYPELIHNQAGYVGYSEADRTDPARPWTFRRVSAKGAWHKYTHGAGAGDLNGDGRLDIIYPDSWWEQPAAREGDPPWIRHDFTFTGGGAQMLVYDVDGDGLNDVLTSLNPHGYGVVWWRQVRGEGGLTFKRNDILSGKPGEQIKGVQFSQPHAQALADVDGDGLLDLVTGKRFWAHGPKGDVEPNAAAVLYWFRLVRDPAAKTATFEPHLIDDHSGVGMQIAVGPAAVGKAPPLGVSNKRGTFVFLPAP